MTFIVIGGLMHKVTFFRPYPFQVGQKITIQGGPRGGDWEVIGVDDKKVKFRCPVSFREFEWAHFCYFAEDKGIVEWPHKD
jgi:hypothetical protein